jgi:hypothetical protein
MELALKRPRSYWIILEVGEQHYDHHKRVAIKIQHQVNRLLDYKVRWSQSRNSPATGVQYGTLAYYRNGLNHIESLTRYNKRTGKNYLIETKISKLSKARPLHISVVKDWVPTPL